MSFYFRLLIFVLSGFILVTHFYEEEWQIGPLAKDFVNFRNRDWLEDEINLFINQKIGNGELEELVGMRDLAKNDVRKRRLLDSILERSDVGIYPVGSTFKKKKIGTGTVLKIDQNNWCIVSAAHVLGGVDPFVILPRQGLTKNIERIYFDNEFDIAIGCFSERIQQAITFDQDKLKPEKNLLKLLTLSSSSEVLQESHEQSNGVAVEYINRFFFPLPSWASKYTSLFKGHESDFLVSFGSQLTSSGDQIVLKIPTTPGMSGGLLYWTSSKGEAKVLGLLSQYNYFFKDSYFTHAKRLVELIKEYQAGRRGARNATTWIETENEFYRRFEDGYNEFAVDEESSKISIMKSAANGLLGDPGNGLLGDPGNGLLGDPGNGLLGDPGNGLLGDPGKNLKFSIFSRVGLVNLNRDNKFVIENASDSNRLSKENRFFGMEHTDGTKVYGFVARKKNNSDLNLPGQFLLYPNFQSLAFMRKMKDTFDFESVYSCDTFQKYALGRLKATILDSVLRSTDSSVETNKLNRENESFKEGEISLVGTSPYEKDHFLLNISEGKFSLENRKLGISVDFDHCMRPKNKKEFFPVIEARSLISKSNFLIDLRNLIFSDLSLVSAGDPATYLGPHLDLGPLVEHHAYASIRFRNEASGFEGLSLFQKQECVEGQNSKFSESSRGLYSKLKCVKPIVF